MRLKTICSDTDEMSPVPWYLGPWMSISGGLFSAIGGLSSTNARRPCQTVVNDKSRVRRRNGTYRRRRTEILRY